MRKILSKQEKSALIDWIIKEVEWHEELFHQIILDFSSKPEAPGEKECRDIIRFHLNEATHNNYIDYGDAHSAVVGADKIMAEAEKAFQNSNYKKALTMANIVIQELVPVLEYTGHL